MNMAFVFVILLSAAGVYAAPKTKTEIAKNSQRKLVKVGERILAHQGNKKDKVSKHMQDKMNSTFGGTKK